MKWLVLLAVFTFTCANVVQLPMNRCVTLNDVTTNSYRSSGYVAADPPNCIIRVLKAISLYALDNKYYSIEEQCSENKTVVFTDFNAVEVCSFGQDIRLEYVITKETEVVLSDVFISIVYGCFITYLMLISFAIIVLFFVAVYRSKTKQTSATVKQAYVIWFFFGIHGLHRFYVGYNRIGLLYFFTFGVLGLGWLVDMFL